MAFTMSTFAESSAKSEVPAAAQQTETAAATETAVNESAATSAQDTSETIVNNNGALETTAPEATNAEETELQNNFEMSMPTIEGNGSAEGEVNATEQKSVSWEDAVKNVDKKEVLKKIGVSDFAIELDEHLKRGGQAIDYLMARAIDYNKVSDIDLIKGDFDKKYSSLSPEDRSALFNDVYKQSEYDDDAQKAVGLIRMKADAHILRQSKIAEQQSFKIPEQMQQQQEVQQQPNYGEQAEATKKYITENQATQAFLQSKRVAIPLGEKDSFNFSINDPNYLIKVMTDQQLWAKHLTDKQGEPDINKMLRIAKYVVDPDAHDMQIYNYGQQKGERKKVEGNQYISKPTTKTGMPNSETLGQAFATRAKVSTYGNKQ